MLFPTVSFALFFAFVLPVSWLLMPLRRTWKIFMIGASYVFYGSADWHFVFLIAGCTVWNQAFAKLLSVTKDERSRSGLVALAVAGDLTLLGWFKYYGFFVANVVNFTARSGLPMPFPLIQVALPIGISFFTFQAISYVVDVKRNQQAAVSTLDFGLYLCFFPHLIAGPIVRVSELVPQFSTARDPRKIEFARAIGLITSGLIKKILIADYLSSQLVASVFASPEIHSRTDVILGVYGFAVQIYCDFSAYTDIAIGLALLLGIRFPDNFNKPYAALSVTEFWHRWHMTLSRWLRDYLYIPLGGNRKGRAKTYRNLMLTMLLGGLWHGAAWTFVIWGGLHGSALAAERWWTEIKGPLERLGPAVVRWALTFNLVCFAWIFFEAHSMSNVQAILSQLLRGGGETTVSRGVVAAIAIGIGIHFIPVGVSVTFRRFFARLGPTAQGLAFASVILITGAVLTGQGVAPFIYYHF